MIDSKNDLNLLKNQILEQIEPLCKAIDERSLQNTAKVLDAFRHHRIAEFHFHGSTGYGYGDAGRDKLDAVWAEIFGAEKAIVRTHFVSGTHALSTVLFGLLRPGDELLAIAGTPYDTMQTVIGYHHSTPGSLTELGIVYKELPLNESGGVAEDQLPAAISDKTKMVLIQRSRGYNLQRQALSVATIKRICQQIKTINPDCICFVDNCYGEFVETVEPTAIGADIMAGSLIKNPGGGIAPTGGYIAGRAKLVDLAACRLTAPGLGSEMGSSLTDKRLLYQGIFLAPHTVAQALKGALFAGALFSALGYKTSPSLADPRGDIIQAIELGSAEKLIAFCRGLQHNSPVDSHVTPEPGLLPGYSDPVIMAAGTFVQGASIELSADAPLRPPFTVYLQGGLTFEHAILGILGAASELLKR